MKLPAVADGKLSAVADIAGTMTSDYGRIGRLVQRSDSGSKLERPFIITLVAARKWDRQCIAQPKPSRVKGIILKMTKSSAYKINN